MANAFQSSAFQQNAFQESGSGAQSVTPSSLICTWASTEPLLTGGNILVNPIDLNFDGTRIIVLSKSALEHPRLI